MGESCRRFDMMEIVRVIDFLLLFVFDSNESIVEIEAASSSSLSVNLLEFALIAKIDLRPRVQFDFWRGVDVNVEYIGRVIDFRRSVYI